MRGGHDVRPPPTASTWTTRAAHRSTRSARPSRPSSLPHS